MQHAGLFLFTRGLSEHACSPTKIGEYWAAGLPVIVSPNVGDIEDLVRARGVGVILEAFSQEAQQQAAQELMELLRSPGLADRCRLAAEEHYSLDDACVNQRELYRNLISPGSQDAGARELNDASKRRS
jgi:glycosyltransferase involved in cell wall biosynthesis